MQRKVSETVLTGSCLGRACPVCPMPITSVTPAPTEGGQSAGAFRVRTKYLHITVHARFFRLPYFFCPLAVFSKQPRRIKLLIAWPPPWAGEPPASGFSDRLAPSVD
ncbi:MAG: hypothetical protein JRE16_10030 [Deltaproteobacteria bacterium]|nr:hypothetical protein [Deltaproteobacteria bacterium]